jgi:hypothetical protein
MTAHVSARPYDALLSSTRDRLLGDAWFYYAVFLYTVFGLVFLYVLGGSGGTAHAAYAEPLFKVFGFFMPAVALGFDAIRVIVRLDHRRPLAFRMAFSSERMASMMAGMIMMAGIVLFMGTFTTIKISLPLLFDGFPHDRLHADIDRMLHFGVDPWRWLHGVAGSEIVRAMLEFNYGTIWFILCFGECSLSPPRPGPMQSGFVIWSCSWCAGSWWGMFLRALSYRLAPRFTAR